MADTKNRLNVVDVYDLAADIGKQFEILIDIHGPESVTNLMPKVITVLEHLETLANNNQKENAEIAELNFAVERLESEKSAKASERIKYEQELEQIEEQWRKESQDLLGMVGRLQDENRKLCSSLQEKDRQEIQKQAEEENQLLMKLQDTVDKQRDQVRALKRELSQKNVDVEAMQGQMERLAKLNADCRRKTNLTQHKAQNLIQEKVDLEGQLHEKEQQINQMKDHIKEIESPHTSVRRQVSEDETDKIEEKLKQEGKMVIDMKDPNRPRFTLNELREVLQERNELKTRLFEVEEELEYFKPPESGDEEFDYDAPVHGPINKEPDEKLHPDKYSESGIRKFFSLLFGKSSSKSSTPKGSPSPQRARQPRRNGHKKSRSEPYQSEKGVKQFFNHKSSKSAEKDWAKPYGATDSQTNPSTTETNTGTSHNVEATIHERNVTPPPQKTSGTDENQLTNPVPSEASYENDHVQNGPEQLQGEDLTQDSIKKSSKPAKIAVIADPV